MAGYQLDLKDPSQAYMFGFLQADGHLYENTRNRGKLTLELNAPDAWIIEQFRQLVPFHSSVRTRSRRTNFSEMYASVVWSVYDREFRVALAQAGLVAGRKSEAIRPPDGEYSEADYFRGVLDADGSLGVTAGGFPFVSLITASETLAQGYLSFVGRTAGCRKTMSRNSRDRVFNIAVFKEEAQTLVECLYYQGCLALPRKLARVPELLGWQRPDGMRKVLRRVWSREQDLFILSHSVEEAARRLERTPASIKGRLRRLREEVTD